MDAAPTRASQAARHSHRGLDGVNFCVAAMQTSFGAFITVYLAKSQWPIGNGLAAGIMGGAGSYLPVVSVFLVAAVLDRVAARRGMGAAGASRKNSG